MPLEGIGSSEQLALRIAEATGRSHAGGRVLPGGQAVRVRRGEKGWDVEELP